MELSEKDLQTRTRILDVATEMFNRHGFNRVTMNEIAEKLGMSKKTLYRFFSGKEELTVAVVMYYRAKFDACIMPIVQEQTDDFTDKLMRIGSVVSTLMGNVPVCFINDLEKYMPNFLREHTEWKRNKISESLGSILREGIQSGAFRSHLSVELITMMYLTLAENLFRPEVFAQISVTPSQLYIAVMRVFFEGIMTDAGREQFRYKILSDAEKLFKSEMLLPW
ncbi:hypothetical protein MASR2M18_10320 [Ignavibacteria bacterium]|nr:TetR/AcrR family transcriptional regulator [Bacteroidota bacterium]MCZ2133025.1 TetR/AcrR family transcriptional regulator [Bacteroidota bacterium]